MIVDWYICIFMYLYNLLILLMLPCCRVCMYVCMYVYSILYSPTISYILYGQTIRLIHSSFCLSPFPPVAVAVAVAASSSSTSSSSPLCSCCFLYFLGVLANVAYLWVVIMRLQVYHTIL